MRKSIIYLPLIISILLLQFAQSQKISVAVLDFEALMIQDDEAKALTNRIRTELVKTDIYQVVERGQMDEILREQGFQLSGCTSEACIVEAGQLLGVKKMLAGSVSKVGDIYSVELRLIDIMSGKIEKSDSYDMQGDIGQLLTTGMKNALDILIGITQPQNQNTSISITEKPLKPQNTNFTASTTYEALYSLSTITIDGQINTSEWSNANLYNINFTRNDGVNTKSGTLYLQHDGTWLYVGVKTNIDAGWDVYLSLRFDGNHDHILSGNSSEPHTDINIQQKAPGAWSGHDRYDYLVGSNTYVATAPTGTQQASYSSTNVNYEFKIKLSDLNTSTGQIIGFYIFNYNHGIIEQSYEFPINSGGAIPSEWEHIKLK